MVRVSRTKKHAGSPRKDSPPPKRRRSTRKSKVSSYAVDVSSEASQSIGDDWKPEIENVPKRRKLAEPVITKREESIAESAEWEDISLGDDISLALSDVKGLILEVEDPTKAVDPRKLRGCVARVVRNFRIQCHETTLICMISHLHYLMNEVFDTVRAMRLSVKRKSEELIANNLRSIFSTIPSILLNHVAEISGGRKKMRLLVAFSVGSTRATKTESSACGCKIPSLWIQVDSGSSKCPVCDHPPLKYWLEQLRSNEWKPVEDLDKDLIKQQYSYVFATHRTGETISIMDVSSSYLDTHRLIRRFLRIERFRADWYYNLSKRCLTSCPSVTHPDQFEIPRKLDDFKNHPVYALERHLLKYESIYPPDAEVVAEFRGSKVFRRECVRKLHSKQTWLKEAKQVKSEEVPYKIVLGRTPQSDFRKGIRDRPELPLFGDWQIEEYEPPEAVDGIVPKNSFGNVDLFKPQMLPRGCVHLRNPYAVKACKRLNVDFATATIDFDTHGGGFSHPVFDGIVVCEEFLKVVEKEIKAIEKAKEENEHKKKVRRFSELWTLFFRKYFIAKRLEGLTFDNRIY